MELWDRMDKRDQVCIPDLEVAGTGGMSHRISRHYGTMGRPEVPVDILWQKWNYDFGNAIN